MGLLQRSVGAELITNVPERSSPSVFGRCYFFLWQFSQSNRYLPLKNTGQGGAAQNCVTLLAERESSTQKQRSHTTRLLSLPTQGTHIRTLSIAHRRRGSRTHAHDRTLALCTLSRSRNLNVTSSSCCTSSHSRSPLLQGVYVAPSLIIIGRSTISSHTPPLLQSHAAAARRPSVTGRPSASSSSAPLIHHPPSTHRQPRLSSSLYFASEPACAEPLNSRPITDPLTGL